MATLSLPIHEAIELASSYAKLRGITRLMKDKATVLATCYRIGVSVARIDTAKSTLVPLSLPQYKTAIKVRGDKRLRQAASNVTVLKPCLCALKQVKDMQWGKRSVVPRYIALLIVTQRLLGRRVAVHAAASIQFTGVYTTRQGRQDRQYDYLINY